MKNIIFYFLSILSFSQISQFPNQLNTNGGCFDDDYTISVGMSLYDSSILNCEDAISYLNNFGYGCSTPLDQINNPFGALTQMKLYLIYVGVIVRVTMLYTVVLIFHLVTLIQKQLLMMEIVYMLKIIMIVLDPVLPTLIMMDFVTS